MSVKNVFILVATMLCFSVFSAAQVEKPTAEPSWKSIASTGSDPAPRYGHAMVFNSQKNVVLMFGGKNYSGTYFGDTWEWDVATRKWTQVATEGPQARAHHAMAYDPVRNVVVMQGGEQEDGSYSPSTWEWTGKQWVYRTGSGPGERCRHRMVYDVARNQMVVFGGYKTDGSTWESYDDTWIWENGGWKEKPSTNAPRYRHGQAMVYDAENKRVLMQGGQHSKHGESDDGSFSNHTFAWNGSKWSLISNGGPADRMNHQMFIDPASGDVLSLGGVTSAGTILPNTFWRFKNNSWAKINGPLPSPRMYYGVATDTKTNTIWLWGGRNVAGSIDDKMWYYKSATPSLLDLKLDRLKYKPRGAFLREEEIIVVLRVKNISQVDSEDYSFEVYLSLDKEIDSFDHKLLDLTVTTAIKAKRKKKIKLLSEIPSDAVPDNYWLIARLTSSADESNTNNNVYVSKKRVVIQ